MQFIINGIIAGSAYALIGLSFAIIYNSSRFFHFAHGAVFTCAAYFCYLFYRLLKIPLLVAIALALVMAVGLGAGLDKLIYSPMRKNRVTELGLLVVSLGIYSVLQNSISLFLGDEGKSLRSGDVVEGISLLGAFITPIQIYLILISLAAFLAIWVVLNYTQFGKALRAVSSDSDLARGRGIDTERIILKAFALGSLLAGLAAILTAMDVDMTPQMGLNALMMGVIAMIVGGVNNIMGTLLGGLILGLAQHIGVWKIGSQWQDAIAFGFLILFLILRPRGFLGRHVRGRAV